MGRKEGIMNLPRKALAKICRFLGSFIAHMVIFSIVATFIFIILMIITTILGYEYQIDVLKSVFIGMIASSTSAAILMSIITDK